MVLLAGAEGGRMLLGGPEQDGTDLQGQIPGP